MHSRGFRMGPAGIAAAVLLSSSPADLEQQVRRSEQAQSMPQPAGTGGRGARSDRRSCAPRVNCCFIAAQATDFRRQQCWGPGDSRMAFCDGVTERARAVCHRLSVRVGRSRKPKALSHVAEGRVVHSGAARQRSEAKWHSGARRPAADQVTAPCPHGPQPAGGSRAEMADRVTVVDAIRVPQDEGSAWGAMPSAPKPQARETGSSLASHRPRPSRVQRVRLSRFPAHGGAR